jgi:4a-hydroxytetrahydrobiopterin dehydratase
MERRLLSPVEIADRLKELDGWRLEGGRLRRDFEFADFTRAFGFMASVALVAESMDHHPEWSNVYNRVSIALQTHSLGGVSTLDAEFARRVNGLLSTAARGS